jgi:predicted  nucleic acid-binding Zn-ribbon protein
MKKADIGVEILKDIRRELRSVVVGVAATNGRIDDTNKRIDDTNTRLDLLRDETSARFDQLGRRLVESELRTATALTDLAGSVREMTSVLRTQHDLRPRVERCEVDIADLKAQLGKPS